MSDNLSKIQLEEYKTLRQEILEIDKRKNNLVVYSVLATATIFGFAVGSPSSFIFLLPVVVLIPLGYKIKTLQDSILHIGIYISVELESKSNNKLKWETYQRGLRLEADTQKKFSRQFPNYLFFDLLAIVCVVASIGYAVLLDENINSFLSKLMLESGQALLTLIVLIILYIIIMLVFVKWTLLMRNCFSAEVQKNYEERIERILHPKEEKSSN